MTNAKHSSHLASGLYTYIGTQRTKNNLKYLVRVDLDEGTTDFLQFPYLMIKDKKTGKYIKHKNIKIHIDSAKLEGNELNLHGSGTIKGKKSKIKLDGIYYVGENKQQELKLNINWDDIAETVSGNPDKILRNMSIKVSALDKGKGPHKPHDHPPDHPKPSKKMYICKPSGHCHKSKHGIYKTKEECMKSCKGSDPWDPVPGGQPKGGPGWKPIGPKPTPPNPTPSGPSLPNFPTIPGFKPGSSTPADINVQIDKNKINGNSSLDNQCPPKYPYAYGTKIQGIGKRCCVGKPMAPNTSGGNYTCDTEGACRGTCAKNSKPCPNPDSSGFCMNNSSITKQNLCPANNPYPMTYYIASMTGERWGGKNHFCCKTDPGPNNDCNPEHIAACAQPQCRKNEEAIQGKDMDFVNSVICSQQIDNFRQLNQHNPKIYNKLNSDGLKIDADKLHLYNTLPYVTYSKMASKSDPSTSTSTEYLLQNTPKKNNNKIKLKLKKKQGNKESITVNIDGEFFNYLKGLKAGSSIFITPTSTDMTTCKSNNKPLYTVSANSYGRDFKWEWEQMGSQTIDPQFVLTNLNMGGSINGKPGPVSGNNNTLNDIINKNSPYIIYKATTSNQLYYYDKTKIPIDCSTPTSCHDTCSGYNDYASKGAIGDRHKYYSMCDKGGGMFCTANNNYMGNIRECDGKKRDYAVPLPYCSGTQNTNGYGYSFNNGLECSETPYTPTYGILRESSVSALNNSSKPCLNTPCCPLTHKEAYVYNKPNTGKTMRLCYNADHGKEYSCNPVKSDVDSLFPSCSNPYIPNKKYIGGNPSIHSVSSMESIGDCKKLCNKGEDCGLYQYNSNTGVCDLFPLITPTELQSGTNSQSSKGTTIGLDYKTDWILDRTFDTGVVPIIDVLDPKKVSINVNGCYNACVKEKACNAFTYNDTSCKLFNSAPTIPKTENGSISLKISNPDAYRTANNYINNPQATVTQAYKLVNENFQSAIENVQLNKNIEHMTNADATNVTSNCSTTGSGSNCNPTIAKTFQKTDPSNRSPSFTQQTCPSAHPSPIHGGRLCGANVHRLSAEEGRGILVSNDTKPCGDKNARCTQYAAADINKYTSTGKTLDSQNKPTNGCLIDLNMQSYGYNVDNNQYVCVAGKQCIGYTHDIDNGNINSNRSTLGYCSNDPKLEKFTYNKSRSGTVLEKSSQASPDYCAYACKQKAECIAFNFDPRIPDNNCTLLSSAVSLTPSGNKGSPGVITSLNIPGYSSAGQKACNKQLKHLPNVSDVHYIGTNKDANALFNTDTQLPTVCQQWNNATWFSTTNYPCSNKEDGSFVKNCNLMIDCKGGKFGNNIVDRPGTQTRINGKTDEDMIADKIGILGACNIAGIHTTPTGGGCYGGRNNGDFKVLPNSDLYNITDYKFSSKKDAENACKKKGYSRLCTKNEAMEHPICNSGWVADATEPGYQMTESTPGYGGIGCGSGVGWQSYSRYGRAGAYCCNDQKTNLIECKDKACKLTHGTTGPNGFKCVNATNQPDLWYAKTDDTSNNDLTHETKCLAASNYTDRDNTFSVTAPPIYNNYDSYGKCKPECIRNNGIYDGQFWPKNDGSYLYDCQCWKEYKQGTSVPFHNAPCVIGSTENECIQNAYKVGGVHRSTYNVATCGTGITNFSKLQNTDDNGRCYQTYDDDGLKKAHDICGNNDQCAGVMGVCYGNICAWEPQFGSLKPNANTKGYTISRHTWATERNSSGDGYCAYKD